MSYRVDIHHIRSLQQNIDRIWDASGHTTWCVSKMVNNDGGSTYALLAAPAGATSLGFSWDADHGGYMSSYLIQYDGEGRGAVGQLYRPRSTWQRQI